MFLSPYRARRGLEREGKGDASDGEWAEVQLELIRQVSRVAVIRWAHLFYSDGVAREDKSQKTCGKFPRSARSTAR